MTVTQDHQTPDLSEVRTVIREELKGLFERTKAQAAEEHPAQDEQPEQRRRRPATEPVVMREVAKNSENSTEWKGTKGTNIVIAAGTVVVAALAIYKGEFELAQWLFTTGIGAAAGVQGLYNVAAGFRKGMAGQAR